MGMLTTILLELWHFSLHSDGDLRRHPSRCYGHTHSERQYDDAMAELARQWLAFRPPREYYAFLYSSFPQLAQQHGGVFGTKIPAPKLIPID